MAVLLLVAKRSLNGLGGLFNAKHEHFARRTPEGVHRRTDLVRPLHIDEPFSAAFAEWLDNQTPHQVVYARDGEPIDSLRGHVTMAPPGRHLIIGGGRIHLDADPPRHSCRPSVDALFDRWRWIAALKYWRAF